MCQYNQKIAESYPNRRSSLKGHRQHMGSGSEQVGRQLEELKMPRRPGSSETKHTRVVPTRWAVMENA